MNNNYNMRNQDLTKVFDARWKANHNNDVKNAKEKEKTFINKLFGIKDSTINNDISKQPVKSSREIQLERLNQNMQHLRNNNLNNRF